MKYTFYGNQDIYILGIENGSMYYSDGYNVRKSKMHFREAKTWDEFMGNKPAGNYFIARFPNRRTKRIYLCDLVEYR